MYTPRYRIPYNRLSNGITTIDILDASYSGDVSIYTGAAPNEVLNLAIDGDVNDIFPPTIGTGASISIYSKPLQLDDLFTKDPQKFMIKVYNGASGVNLIWQGFVNSNVFSEQLSKNVPSAIYIQCNDGMNVLDKLYYRNVNGTLYTGIVTIGEVFTNIFSKIQTKYNYIYTNTDLKTPSAQTNLFTQLKVNNDNYFDENLVPMTCREVLNSIIGGLGLTMQFSGDSIYIFDPINLSTPTNGKVYDTSTFTENASTFGGNLDISKKDWNQTGLGGDKVAMITTPKVNYDPYTIIGFSYDFGDSKNWSTVGTFNHITSPSPNDFYRNSTVVFKDWTQSGGSHFRGLRDASTEDPIYALYVDASGDILTYTIPYSTISADSTLSIRINLESYLQTRNNDSWGNQVCGDNIYATGGAIPVYAYYIQFSVKVGDQYYKDDHWESGETGNYHQLLAVRDWTISDADFVAHNDHSLVGDTWCPIKPKLIPLLSPMTSGTIEFKIYNILTSTMITRQHANDPNTEVLMTLQTAFRKLLLKDFKLDFVDSISQLPITNKGTLFTGTFNDSSIYKIESNELKLTNGTGIYGTSRGAFRDVDSNNITGLRRGADATIYDTAALVLQSISSQYRDPRSVVSGVLKAATYQFKTNLHLIQYADLSDKSFYIVNATYSDKPETMNMKMIECVSTRVSI